MKERMVITIKPVNNIPKHSPTKTREGISRNMPVHNDAKKGVARNIAVSGTCFFLLTA
jgi:hypothetical protein